MTRSGTPSQTIRKPTAKEIEVLDILARGLIVTEAAQKLGLRPRSLDQRLKRLRIISGGRLKKAALVYWGLTEMYIHYPKKRRPRPSQARIDVVNLLAQDYTHAEIAEKLALTKHGVATRVASARAKVGARTEAQLVAIYWSEDWIA